MYIPPTGEERFDLFKKGVELQKFSGPDRYTLAHDQEFATALEKSEELETDFREFFETFNGSPPRLVALLIPKITQLMEWDRDPNFPKGRTTADKWYPTMKRLIRNPEYQELYLHHLRFPNSANISERYKLLKAALLLNGRTGPVSVLDAGCSLNNGLRRLAAYEDGEFPFSYTEVVQPESGRRPWSGAQDEAKTGIFNRLTQTWRLELGPSVGIDLIDAENDPEARARGRSHSFYMGELRHKEQIDKFDRISAIRHENVGYYFRDIAQQDLDIDGRQFDAVNLMTVLYQLQPNDVKAALVNAKKVVKPDGLIVVSDFVEFSPEGIPTFYPRWHWKGNFGVWVLDMQKQELGWQKYFSVESGRIKKVMLEPALGQLAVARETGLVPPIAA